jgi:dTDP-4-dehydrorhamnose 3,5-epimerase
VKVDRAAIPEVLVLEPDVFRDTRGFFFESYNRGRFAAATGLDIAFVQDNQSRSARNVLRGLHYQLRQPQGKLVRVVTGEIWDVAVDLRRGSPSFGRWAATTLDAESHRMLWIPAGFAHGFVVLSEQADVVYKATDFSAPEHERTLLWNDPAIGIPWPQAGEPVMTDKDRRGSPLSRAETFD